MQRGFTIVESFVAISILLVAIVGPMSIVAQGLSASIFAKEQMIATMLGQEAVEAVRNKRDTNVLAGVDWLNGTNGVCNNPNGCLVDVHKEGNSVFSSCSSSCPVMTYNSSTGQYGHTNSQGWEDSLFTRQVIVDETSNDEEARVTVTVTWETGLFTKTITVNEILFNWQGEE